MNKLLEWTKAYKELIAGLVVIAGISAWVARGIASEAEKKADATAQALLEVAKTQTALAQTQQQLGLKVEKQEGRMDALLASLSLSAANIKALQAMPRSPKLLPNDSTKIACGQSWLKSNATMDTIVMVVVTESCKVAVYPVYPEATR